MCDFCFGVFQQNKNVIFNEKTISWNRYINEFRCWYFSHIGIEDTLTWLSLYYKTRGIKCHYLADMKEKYHKIVVIGKKDKILFFRNNTKIYEIQRNNYQSITDHLFFNVVRYKCKINIYSSLI